MLKEAVSLPEILSSDFKFVRVDFLINDDRLYFNEMTFTPFSGHFNFKDKKTDYLLGDLLKLYEVEL